MESAGTTTVTGGVVSPRRIFLLGHPHPRRSRSRPRHSTSASAATPGTVPARVGGHRAGPVGGSQVVSISSARRTSKTCRTNSSCCASSCAYGTNSRTGSTSAGPAAVQPRPEPSDPQAAQCPDDSNPRWVPIPMRKEISVEPAPTKPRARGTRWLPWRELTSPSAPKSPACEIISIRHI